MNEIKSIFLPEYQLRVSEFGEISKLKGDTRKVYAHNKCHAGYHRISITTNGERRNYSVHRLVAKSFIPNPNNYPEVNHLDLNKSNNHYTNLEWCTHKQNQDHLIESGKWSPRNRFFKNVERNKLILKDLAAGMVRKEVANKYGLSKAAIMQVIVKHGRAA